jgi:WD40-like Beta Propeller Repeat
MRWPSSRGAAVELRRRLGDRVGSIVAASWLVLDPPPAFVAALETAQDPERWREGREQLYSLWLTGAPEGVVEEIRREMDVHDFDMCSRAARANKGASQIATMAPDGSDRELLVPRGTNIGPSWSPDGAMIVFSRAVLADDGTQDVFVVDVATGSRTRVTNTPRHPEFAPTFSPNGLQIAFTRARRNRAADIWIADVDGSNPTRVTDTPSKDEFQLSWQAI